MFYSGIEGAGRVAAVPYMRYRTVQVEEIINAGYGTAVCSSVCALALQRIR